MATRKAAASCVKLCPKCLGIACGLIWGVGIFLTALLDAETGFGGTFVGSIGSVYIGYGPSAFGGILGLIYGFIDGFVGGYLVAWIYNKICKC